MDTQGQQIIKQLREGDEKGINALFSLYFAPLCQVALRIVHNLDTAKDIVQDVFVKLWTHRMQLQIKTSLMGYLKQSVVNASIDHQRLAYEQRKVSLDHPATAGPEPLSAGSEAADIVVEGKEVALLVDQAIARLPPRCRLVFTLSRHHGLTYKQIAAQLDISTKTVENQMTKALQTLRALLAPLLSLTGFLWLFNFFSSST